MKSNTQPAWSTDSTAQMKRALFDEIWAKWNNFTEQELSSLEGNDDLVAQVAMKYGLERGQAQQAVDELLNGRQI
jgi:hypothetical protein